MFFLFSLYSDWALALLRIILGIVLLVHGWPKLRNLKATSANFGAMGFKPGVFWGPLAAFAEFFGGLALILGVWTEFTAAVIAIQFIVITIWKIIRRQPFTMRVVEGFVGGLEYDLLILGTAILFLAEGAGALSLDRLFL